MSTSPVLTSGYGLEAKHRTIPPEDQSAIIVILEEYRQTTKSLPTETNNASNQEHIYFPLTIDSDLCAEAQAILHRTCGDAIDAIKLEPLTRKHQTKLWVQLKANAYNMALHAIILGLPAAEFGSIIHLHATPSLGA